MSGFGSAAVKRWFAMPGIALLALVLALSAGPVSGSAAEREEGRDIAFQWAFGALQRMGNDQKLISVDRDMILKSGDQLKLLVVPKSECFVYVIHCNDSGEVKLLFPYNLDQFNGDYKVDRGYYIPRGNEWFELDKNIGRETFYLLASPHRLTALEDLIRWYETVDADRKPEAGKVVVGEIRKVEEESRQLASAAVERPVRLAGNVRGIEKPRGNGVPDIADIATDISGTGFYGKTFSIEHQ